MNNIKWVELALFKWRPLPNCLLEMFLLSSISMFKFNKWLHRFHAVSAALSLSDLIVGVKNVTSVSGKVSLARLFSFRGFSKTPLDVEQVASFVPMWTVMCFGFLWRIGCTQLLRLSAVAPGNFLILTLCCLESFPQLVHSKLNFP